MQKRYEFTMTMTTTAGDTVTRTYIETDEMSAIGRMERAGFRNVRIDAWAAL